MSKIKEQIEKCIEMANKIVVAHNNKPKFNMVDYTNQIVKPCKNFCPGVDSYIKELKLLVSLLQNEDDVACSKLNDLIREFPYMEANGEKCFSIFTACRIDSLLVYLQSKFIKVKEKKIFISHSTNDKMYAEKLVKLFQSLGLSNKHIFCSSVPKYDIPIGSGDIYEYLRKQFADNHLLVLMLLSENYYNSTACLNEMGASWIRRENYQSILLPKFEYKQIEGAINPRDVTFKLEDKSNRKNKMDELCFLIFNYLELDMPEKEKWGKERNKFLLRIDKLT